MDTARTVFWATCVFSYKFPMAVKIVESEANIKEIEETLIYLLLFSNTSSKSSLLLTIIPSPYHSERTRTRTISGRNYIST